MQPTVCMHCQSRMPWWLPGIKYALEWKCSYYLYIQAFQRQHNVLNRQIVHAELQYRDIVADEQKYSSVNAQKQEAAVRREVRAEKCGCFMQAWMFMRLIRNLPTCPGDDCWNKIESSNSTKRDQKLPSDVLCSSAKKQRRKATDQVCRWKGAYVLNDALRRLKLLPLSGCPHCLYSGERNLGIAGPLWDLLVEYGDAADQKPTGKPSEWQLLHQLLTRLKNLKVKPGVQI